MNLYKATKGNISYESKFLTYEDAVTGFAVLGQGFTITDLGPVIPISDDEKYQYQIDESRKLAKEFFVDIRKKNGKINPNFVTIFDYLEQGELSDADAAIQASNRPELTAELKQKYNTLITDILNYNGL